MWSIYISVYAQGMRSRQSVLIGYRQRRYMCVPGKPAQPALSAGSFRSTVVLLSQSVMRPTTRNEIELLRLVVIGLVATLDDEFKVKCVVTSSSLGPHNNNNNNNNGITKASSESQLIAVSDPNSSSSSTSTQMSPTWLGGQRAGRGLLEGFQGINRFHPHHWPVMCVNLIVIDLGDRYESQEGSLPLPSTHRLSVHHWHTSTVEWTDTN